MDEQLGYDEYSRSDSNNSRNDVKTKKLISSYGEILIEVLQDRNSEFEPKVVGKYKKDISNIEQKIISIYNHRKISSERSDVFA